MKEDKPLREKNKTRRPQKLPPSWVQPGALSIVLIEPRIPQNTGSIARLCAATGSRLEIVAPLFELDDKKMLRAGLDYWPYLDVTHFESSEQWHEENKAKLKSGNAFFIEIAPGAKLYTEQNFAPSMSLIFGNEEGGLPKEWLRMYPAAVLQIPQINVRSMNLAMCAGIVCLEAYRQLGFPYATK